MIDRYIDRSLCLSAHGFISQLSIDECCVELWMLLSFIIKLYVHVLVSLDVESGCKVV